MNLWDCSRVEKLGYSPCDNSCLPLSGQDCDCPSSHLRFMVRDLIISDLHLGNPSCNRKSIIELLSSRFEKLIVNGDVFSCYHFNNLKPIDFSILEALEYFQSKNKCVCIKGNHEMHVKTEKYTSLKFVDYFIWERFGFKLGAVHGHKFNLLNAFSDTKGRALDFARKHNCSAVFAGHNHTPMIKKENDIVYINTGAFTGWGANYGTIEDDKKVYLRRTAVKPLTIFPKNTIIDI